MTGRQQERENETRGPADTEELFHLTKWGHCSFPYLLHRLLWRLRMYVRHKTTEMLRLLPGAARNEICIVRTRWSVHVPSLTHTGERASVLLLAVSSIRRKANVRGRGLEGMASGPCGLPSRCGRSPSRRPPKPAGPCFTQESGVIREISFPRKAQGQVAERLFWSVLYRAQII